MNYKFLILLRNVSYIGHAIYLKLSTEKKNHLQVYIGQNLCDEDID